MDNGQLPPIQNTPLATVPTPSGTPMVQQVNVLPEQKKDISGLIKTIVIVVLSLIAVTFVGLFVWMYMQYTEAQSDLDYKIGVAVADAKDEQAQEDAIKKQNDDKYPYRTFAGPADYGQLTFEYPKTWSVYVASDASSGGDFSAYFNPIQVNTVSKDTINALRVTILNEDYESVVTKYQKEVDKKGSNLTVQSVTVGDAEKGTQVTANRYAGTIPSTDLSGYIVIFKIRDKTVIMQTDSVLFEDDFNKLLDTVTFNA